MVKHIEILEKLKSGERMEVPFDFFIECSFHIMEFWDQISHTVRTETKVDAKSWDVKNIKINEPYFKYPISEEFKANNSKDNYIHALYKSVEYNQINIFGDSLLLLLPIDKFQNLFNKDETRFKEILDEGYRLKPFVEFHRSTNATYYNYQTRKLKLKEFSKMFDDLKDCKCVTYIRDTIKHFDDGLENIKEETIKLTHIHFELWRNENKRFESAHKILYKLKNVEERKSILYIN